MAAHPELDRLRREPERTALFTDFDGTLAPIVDDPAAVRPEPGAVDALAALAGHYAMVGVITGRPASFVEQFVPPSVVIAGLYGLEVVHDGTRREHADAERWRDVIAGVAAAAHDDGPRGMRVEPKGLSLTLHYREAAAIADDVVAWARDAARRTGLEARDARMSVELHPPIAVDKGTALLDLARDARAACFLGDDTGDLRAFDALDALAGKGIDVVRIAVRSDEAPDALLARADLAVDGPAGAVALLRELLDD